MKNVKILGGSARNTDSGYGEDIFYIFKRNRFIIFSIESPILIILPFSWLLLEFRLDKMDYSISFHALPNKSNISFRTNLNGQFMLISRDTGFNISINVGSPGRSAGSVFCYIV